MEDWERSVHYRSGITCDSCHIVASVQAPSGQRAVCPEEHQNALAMCGHCHRDVAGAFRESAHFRRASSGSATPVCIDCHSAAGASILSGDLVPQRCATCHRADGSAGTPWVAEKAPELLQLLHRVTLARAMDRERLDQLRRRGDDTTAMETEMGQVDASFRDIPFEWHRFNLGDAEDRSRRALGLLEALHGELEQRSARSEAEPLEMTSAGAAATPQGRPLRVAVASIVSPAATYEEYRGLFDDLGHALGRPYEFVQRRTYHEINELLLQGEVDLAFICSGGYAAFPKDAPIEILAVPVVNGKHVYHSLIVVRKNSSIQRFNELEGVRFAFTDPLSNTGHLYVVFRLRELGKDPQHFFASTLFSGSHDQSLLAVSRGLVDAAAVNELVYRHPVMPNSTYEDDFRVIETSPDFGNPPVVAPTTVPEELRVRMREFLLHLADTPQGRERLATLGLDGFTVGGRELYETVREMREATSATAR